MYDMKFSKNMMGIIYVKCFLKVQSYVFFHRDLLPLKSVLIGTETWHNNNVAFGMCRLG